MAIIHKASIIPTKGEILERVLGGSVAVLGAYRFDDPDGEVGVEGFVVRRGTATQQVVLTYRSAPVEGAEGDLVSTMEHSTLGRRWVYDGRADPVALACFRRALLGEQEQAVEEIWDEGQVVGTREPTARLTRVAGHLRDANAVVVIETDLEVAVEHVLGPHLRAEWDGGGALVARLG